MNIVFMGTPEFSVPVLIELNKSSHSVVCVVTVPDKLKGRGRKLSPSPVKSVALDLNIPVLQPAKLSSTDFIKELKTVEFDIIITAAFRILPKKVFSIPRHGALNLHGSILPYYRGPAPVQWAIINGEKETGVTTFKIDDGIDTGGIYLTETVSIGNSENAGDITNKLSKIGAELMLKTVNGISDGSLHPLKQNNDLKSHAPKIFSQDQKINWNDTSLNISRKINGLSPYNAVRVNCNDNNFKFYRAVSINSHHLTQPGNVIFADKENGLIIQTKKDAVSILEIQREGKRVMNINDFLLGTNIKPGDKFQ